MTKSQSQPFSIKKWKFKISGDNNCNQPNVISPPAKLYKVLYFVPFSSKSHFFFQVILTVKALFDDRASTRLWNNLNTTYYNELEFSKWVKQSTNQLQIGLKHTTKYLI